MQKSDVTRWGRDYSAREFTPQEFDRYQRENPGEPPVQWLDRYIGYPRNPKCISHYPGMYRRHWETGRPVSLFHQIGYTDMEGGFNGGRAHAHVAMADAKNVGWDGESHITACMDRFYAKPGLRTLTAADLREYMRGFRSVLGDRAGFYGFFDSMRSAVQEGWASFFVQCGARSAHIPGIHAWQENNYQPRIFGTGTDILELYCSEEYAFGGTVSSIFTQASKDAYDITHTQVVELFNALIGERDENGHPLIQQHVNFIVDTLNANFTAQMAGLTAAVKVLADKVGTPGGEPGLTPGEIEEAVEKAIRESMLRVDVTVQNRITPEEGTGTEV